MSNPENLKSQSLELFAERLSEQTYPGYPENDQRLKLPAAEQTKWLGRLVIPQGPWSVNDLAPEAELSSQAFSRSCATDSRNRPLHPWHREILENQRIGAVTGKGFYWQWGPNKTGDPVIIRHDINDTPQILLIDRKDTGDAALPGGFFDENLDKDCVDTALREAWEETLTVDARNMRDSARIAYEGPVADIRSTIHAWPETTVVRIDLPNELARHCPELEWPGGDEVLRAYWSGVDVARSRLFGSHRLLIDQALES